MSITEKKRGYISSTVLMAVVLGSALAYPTTEAFAWNNNNCDNDKYKHCDNDNNNCEHHKYGDVCDKSKQDVTCDIVSPANHAVFHTGSHKHVSVEFTIQASDSGDGIKNVRVHLNHDNAHTKTAVLGGDGFYHVTWNTLGKGSHHVQATCDDFANNKKQDSITIHIEK